MRLIAILIVALTIFGCNSSNAVSKRITDKNSKHDINDSSSILKSDSVLYTGWYFVSDTSTGYKKRLIKSTESFYIEPAPIVTAANFDRISMFHEKDCWAITTWLNKKGAQLLNAAKQNAKEKKLAFILDNKLLRLQSVDDPQFASVEDNVDPRIYGEVLTFPCNSFSPDELKRFETIVKNEK